MSDEPEQPALFLIEGPDEDGCVWACSSEGRDGWCQNLGPKAQVIEVLSQWLGEIDADEASPRSERSQVERTAWGTSQIGRVSEDCWARFEGLRQRLKSIGSEADKAEVASIDAEMIDLRELVLATLRPSEENGSAASGLH